MSKLFIFGIGGTGSRVLRSLAMLMASGVEMGTDEIVPIIIDPDAGNADLTRTTSLLNKYISIGSYLTQPNKNRFFHTKITSAVQNHLLELVETSSNTFSQYIGLDTMDTTAHSLMEMLFSKRNLDSDMKVGFKGNPNIGSVVLNQIVNSQAFKNFESMFSSGDKIFIINSIFGGTGASGFPLLLKILRTSDAKAFAKAPMIANSRIGAVTVLPYFSLEKNDESSIDSSTFLSKAKSALAYYEDNIYKNNQIDDLYFIGDTILSKPYKNHEGGPDQQNEAHLIEMMAATAIVDFSRSSSGRSSRSCHELGLNDMDDSESVTFDELGNGLNEMLFKPMTEFTLMANTFHYRYNMVSDPDTDCNKLGSFSGIFKSDFMRLWRGFLEDYREWLSEMQNNKRTLKLFNLDSERDPFQLVTNKPAKSAGIFGRKRYDALFHSLSKSYDNMTKIKKDDPNSFAEMYYLAMESLINKKF